MARYQNNEALRGAAVGKEGLLKLVMRLEDVKFDDPIINDGRLLLEAVEMGAEAVVRFLVQNCSNL